MKKVLIANRGEIVVRVARACADYGLESVAVYADPDADALHVRTATEAWGLPGSSAATTYLNIDALLDVAVRSGADAVHPGYGFLSESAEFARRVIAAGLTWIGPTPETIDQLGDKISARRIAQSVGAPLVAGTPGPVADADEVRAFAEQCGLPIAIKAAAGGGGRGMRVVHRMDEVGNLYESAVREAVAAFGRGDCFVEQYLDRPRHVEAQVLGDGTGHVVVIGTRDCSVQRRHQKLVEEAPAPFLTAAQRELIGTAAHDVAAAVDYRGVGTVEFLVGSSGAVSFLEVNTRLQVEHPVTEATTGVDLVRQQLLVADGRPLDVTSTPEPTGHAIEFRVNAEDPGRGFLPTPGTVGRFDVPGGPGVRVDSGVVAGSTVPGSYDSLVAKLVVTGRDRQDALVRARQALREFHVTGIATVLPFPRRLLADPAFTGPDGLGVHTRWIETECGWTGELGGKRVDPPDEEPVVQTWVEIDGRRATLRLPAVLSGSPDRSGPAAGDVPAPEVDPAPLLAPVAGSLVRWCVEDGAEVVAGETVALVEAMKMETAVAAHRAGRIRHLAAHGAHCALGTPLARVEATP